MLRRFKVSFVTINVRMKKLNELKAKLDYLVNLRLRSHPLFYHFIKGPCENPDIKIIGLIRERNEELLLKTHLTTLQSSLMA